MKSRTINPDLLPILTETADGTVIDLPTLTEALGAQLATAQRAFPLTDEQCMQLAERLFPQLEATLRETIGSRSEARWEKSMQQVRVILPSLIRDAVQMPG
ncbi:hypothetical protein [Sideroxydans lithotrophicus]|uniref:Uncharacterized protein n=1 Tax=Sideroxydans lithotrophicus (strain ES-1) TaxID=580332 RepID=D5CMG6_SIDLE|nr:hypothetical protein [Sideroxydans lithotrophicus]ADE12638.1 hypothetical protein Slit_2412 [Sideroxydans lithotrophicus ES-1]